MLAQKRPAEDIPPSPTAKILMQQPQQPFPMLPTSSNSASPLNISADPPSLAEMNDNLMITQQLQHQQQQYVQQNDQFDQFNLLHIQQNINPQSSVMSSMALNNFSNVNINNLSAISTNNNEVTIAKPIPVNPMNNINIPLSQPQVKLEIQHGSGINQPVQLVPINLQNNQNLITNNVKLLPTTMSSIPSSSAPAVQVMRPVQTAVQLPLQLQTTNLNNNFMGNNGQIQVFPQNLAVNPQNFQVNPQNVPQMNNIPQQNRAILVPIRTTPQPQQPNAFQQPPQVLAAPQIQQVKPQQLQNFQIAPNFSAANTQTSTTTATVTPVPQAKPVAQQIVQPTPAQPPVTIKPIEIGTNIPIQTDVSQNFPEFRHPNGFIVNWNDANELKNVIKYLFEIINNQTSVINYLNTLNKQ